ncbi:hypothetical protein VKT23_004161 [Stygiomarasmius scandens]|uniref:C3H1-type domain-containing protein n=1 Tax=Marasmiellus scandens TaxID=2682957 RepID=A0ABR1JTF8_9AGAR
MSKNIHGVPFKKYQCRYFDEHTGQPLRTRCNQGDNCRFVHPTDPNWPGLKCHPVIPGYSSHNHRNFSGNNRVPRDRSQRSHSPSSRAAAPLVPQDDLFRRCKMEEDDNVLSRRDDLYPTRKTFTGNSSSQGNGTVASKEDSVEFVQRKNLESEILESANNDSKSTKQIATGPRFGTPPGRMKKTNEQTDEPTPIHSPSDDPTPVDQSTRSRQLVDVFRKITTVSSQIVQDTLTLNQEERKLHTYNDISATLSRISESAASAVAPPLAEIILTHAQSKERLEEGFRTLGESWDKVFDIFVTDVTQTINNRLEVALESMRDEAKYLAEESTNEAKTTLKRKSNDHHSDEDVGKLKGHMYSDELGRSKHGHSSSSSRDAKRRKTSSSDDHRDDIRDLSSLDEILLQMKLKIDQQNNSLQMLAKENEELKGQLQLQGGRTQASDSPIPRGPKDRHGSTQTTPRHGAPSANEIPMRSGDRPRPSYSRGDERGGHSYRDSRSRVGDVVKRRN